MSRIDGLPAVPDAALPADVRRGTRADKDAYASALGFERLLDRQLVQAMAAGQEGPMAEGVYASTVQDAMTDSLTAAGGIGLARTLYAQLRPGSTA